MSKHKFSGHFSDQSSRFVRVRGKRSTLEIRRITKRIDYRNGQNGFVSQRVQESSGKMNLKIEDLILYDLLK